MHDHDDEENCTSTHHLTITREKASRMIEKAQDHHMDDEAHKSIDDSTLNETQTSNIFKSWQSDKAKSES